jgi:Regulator of G protein signaling domain
VEKLLNSTFSQGSKVMAELITHQEWKTGKKKYELTSPKTKQDIGPTLDKFHKASTVKDKVKFLQQIIAGFKVYRDDNKDNAKAKQYLEGLLKESKAKLDELKKDALKDPDILAAVTKACKGLNLEDIWKDPTYKELFKKFNKTGGLENFNFLVAVEQRKGAWIFTQFVQPGSPQEVNLTKPILTDLQAQYQDDPNKVTYRDAYNLIWDELRREKMNDFRLWSPLLYAAGEKLGIL